MKVALNLNQNSYPNFGMALFMKPQIDNAEKIGCYPASQLEFARPSLQVLAQDVNIKISPIHNKEQAKCGVKIKITKVTDSPLKKLFYFGKKMSTVVRLNEVGCYVNFPDLVLKKARNMKAEFVRYI